MDFRRIVLNFIPFFFGSMTKTKVVHTIFLLMLLYLEFTLNFSIIMIGSFNIRGSREALPTEVRSPEIIQPNPLFLFCNVI